MATRHPGPAGEKQCKNHPGQFMFPFGALRWWVYAAPMTIAWYGLNVDYRELVSPDLSEFRGLAQTNA
jgi:hypothetical protein